MMKRFIQSIIAFAAAICITGCRDKLASHPPYRDEVDPPAGFSRDGKSWEQIPSNMVDVVKLAIKNKGYNLNEYWDPQIEHKTNEWHIHFQGTMADPGFYFDVFVDKNTQKIEFLSGR